MNDLLMDSSEGDIEKDYHDDSIMEVVDSQLKTIEELSEQQKDQKILSLYECLEYIENIN